MMGNCIFLEKSIKTEVVDITSEITNYIDTQQKNRMLNPEFFDSILLLIAELLLQKKNQSSWIDLGYKICRYYKHNIENYGYNPRTAMFGGLGYQCYAVNAFCSQANILRGFSHSMDKLLLVSIDDRLAQIENHPTVDNNYDMISGISGVLYYLLDRDYTNKEKSILIKCIQYLLSFTQDTKFSDKAMIGFHVLQENQNPNFDKQDFKNGSINFGLAHGMLGPLIVLAKAYAKGFEVDGLKEGIEKIYCLYEIYQFVNDAHIPYWPGIITVEEYWEKACKSEHLHRPSSWCYGNMGILRGLQKVSNYMNWPQKEQIYIDAMKHVLTQDIKTYNLYSPSLCHGFASVVAIQSSAYSAYRDPKLLTNLERNVRAIVTGYRKNNEEDTNLIDIREGTVLLEGYLKDSSLLTGSVGIAVTLLSLQGAIGTGKLLMID